MKRKPLRVRQVKKGKTRPRGAKAEIEDLVRTGVEKFILEDATIDEFLKALRSAAKKEKISSHPLTRTVFTRIVKEAIDTRKKRLDKAW